jgi:hypothetical protein
MEIEQNSKGFEEENENTIVLSERSNEHGKGRELRELTKNGDLKKRIGENEGELGFKIPKHETVETVFEGMV